MSVYLIATLDTKGLEATFLRDRLASLGVSVRVVDAGCQGEPGFAADVGRDEVFAAAGTSAAALVEANDRGRAVTAAAEGVAVLAAGWFAANELDGLIGLGGSAGTTIATAAMRAVPLGVPKLMVSTLASGQVRPWVGDKDILMLNSVVDLAGINRISRSVLDTAARAIAGLVDHPPVPDDDRDRPLVAATMFGVTTPCVERARQQLEQAGYEVLVFHATGNGGQAMESLIADGLIAGVLDITTTELADELVGGILSAGPDRLAAAGRAGIPQVISVGACDMVNFGPPDTIPDSFADRVFYQHNPTVTLMRTTVEENREIGEEIGRKAAAATGPVTILLPARGVSAIDADGQPFDNPAARDALFEAIRQHADDVAVERLDLHINDDGFADRATELLIELMPFSREGARSPG